MNFNKMNNLNAVDHTTIADTDLMLVQTEGETKKITAAELKSYTVGSVRVTTATAVASGDTGYTTGDQVYNAIEAAIGNVLNTEF